MGRGERECDRKGDKAEGVWYTGREERGEGEGDREREMKRLNKLEEAVRANQKKPGTSILVVIFFHQHQRH